MKRILYTLFASAAVLLASCVREEAPSVTTKDRPVEHEGEEVMVYFGVEQRDPVTRTLGENPDIQSLHVAVFGSSGYLKEYKLAEPVNGYVSAEGTSNKKGYRVSLSITSSRVRVHLIANGPESLDFDYESVVMSKLTCSSGSGAYWQRILLDHGIYADTEAPGYYDTPPTLVIDPDFDLDTDGVTHKMALIPLIRNYAKIIAVADPVAESNFTINSFAVVNVPDKGSIAPYNPANGEFMMNYHTYPTLNALSAVYPGNLPAETTIDKSYPSETDFANLTNGVVGTGGAVYMYERPVPVSDATILIVYGTYTDPDTGNQFPGYYKIDMMDGGSYLPILRNFRYQINIKKVNRKGKSTVIGAINGAGSADISADVSTASQTGISDGKSAISVSFTELTLPIGGTYTVGVSFTPDVTTGIEDNSLISYELLAPDSHGAVIASASDISYDANTGTLTFTTTDVDPLYTKTQKIRIIGTSETSRLYREVTIRLLPQQTMSVSCIPEIEAEPGTPQTITVSIPQDLPQSIFPLHFQVEVAAKTLTPSAGDLPVEPGQTIVPGSSGNSFQFVKTLSWSDYNAGYTGNVSQFTCEFKSIVGASDSYVYVANQFFSTGSTHFITFQKRYFSQLQFNTVGAINEDDPVIFSFVMDAAHEDPSEKLIPETVDVWLTGLVPDYDNVNFNDQLTLISGNHYVYDVPQPGTGTHRLYLLSTGETPEYDVALSAEYYEDNHKTNVPLYFSNTSFGTVFYGRGWPTTFSFTIPTCDIPAVGYMDIELNLTNLAPNNDPNIIEANGKYYFRTTSTGAKTINLKTAGSQTASVSVELIYKEIVPLTTSQTTRTYLSLASGKVTNSAPQVSNAFRRYSNTVNIYTDKNGSNLVGSYTTTASTNSSVASNSAVNFTAAVDADTKLYLSMYSQYNSTTYRASSIAEWFYNNGNGSTVTFSGNAFGTTLVTVNTTSANYSTTNRSYTNEGVTVAFSNLSNAYSGYVTMADNSTVTISVPEGYHMETMTFSYDGNYYPQTTTVTSGGGTYSGTTTGTWTAANSTTRTVVLTMRKRNNRTIYMVSVIVRVVED